MNINCVIVLPVCPPKENVFLGSSCVKSKSGKNNKTKIINSFLFYRIFLIYIFLVENTLTYIYFITARVNKISTLNL